MPNNKEKPKLVISDIYAYLSVDEDGNEGLIGELINGAWMPFVACDKARLDSLEPIAQRVAQRTGRPVRLIHLSTRTEIKTLDPSGVSASVH